MKFWFIFEKGLHYCIEAIAEGRHEPELHRPE
jgi:hypothetical protein